MQSSFPEIILFQVRMIFPTLFERIDPYYPPIRTKIYQKTTSPREYTKKPENLPTDWGVKNALKRRKYIRSFFLQTLIFDSSIRGGMSKMRKI